MITRRDFLAGASAAAVVSRAGASPVKSIVSGKEIVLMEDGKLSAKSYIQDGLIIQFDAIENYAYGEHVNLTDRWYDLISGGYCTPNSSYQVYRPLSWHDGYVESLGSVGFNLLSSTVTIPSDVSDYTIEYITSEHIFNGASLPRLPNGASCKYEFDGSGFGNYYSFGVKNATTNNPSGNGNKYSVSELLNGKSLVVVNQSGHGRYIVDYMYDKQCETDTMGSAAEKNFILGGGYGYYFKFHAARMYRRALTNEELSHNREIDKARFNLP